MGRFLYALSLVLGIHFLAIAHIAGGVIGFSFALVGGFIVAVWADYTLELIKKGVSK